ncbi:hypothetical protein ACLMJK_009481 [Lecanora helva]
MGNFKRVENSSTITHNPTQIDKEKYFPRDSSPIPFIEKNQNHSKRPIYFKWKPVHNLQTTPADSFRIRAIKSGIRKFQFAGHWAIEIGGYTWELWQDAETHRIALGEENRGPVRWTDLCIIRQSDGEVVKTEPTLKKVKGKRCGWTTMTDAEIRDHAMKIINSLQTEKTALSRMDRLVQWDNEIRMKALSRILDKFGPEGRKAIEGMVGLQAEVRAGLLKAVRGGDNSDQQYRYDVFFRNCHTFAEKLAKKVTSSPKKTKVFFTFRHNAKAVLYNQMTLNSMPPSLQAEMQNQQLNVNQQLMLGQQQQLLTQ